MFKSIGFALLASTGLLTASAVCADTLDTIKERDKLVVGVKTDYAPYGYLNDDGEIVGFEIELAKYVAKELLGSEEKIELVPVVASNRIDFLASGRLDVIFATLGISAARDEVIDFTTQYVSAAGPSILAPEASKLTEWEQYEGRPVCGIQGSYFNKKMTEEFGMNLIAFKSQTEAYRALKDNRCVGMVFDDMTLRLKTLEPEWTDYKIAAQPYEFAPMGGGVREGDTVLKEAIDKAIHKAEGEGKLIEWEAEFNMPASEYIAERAKTAGAE
ncbi:transporter substrate-binding domain-containing protein [Alloyangia pacifica]|uniref:Polar amino acid transport system substrate-binding protein n=1 Tax=Alloyangia pacifica TaxID=311180 RepID=A0A1I6RMV0_9RHOB|nr:transporter substrate-binding domain-containing protein [Alloyangia pacifica]SDG53642.1 polar amino acid transport system substrate-binding protein [Alloyangia pacifica]SFS66061.1 polar amino acid transport system substrate-binding protein [Alloyangia pacifica]